MADLKMDHSYKGKIRFIDDNKKLTLIIPSDRNLFLVITVIPFIFIWLFVELYVFPKFFMNDTKANFVWFLGWTFCGIYLIRLWVWHVLGKTIFIIDNGFLIIKKRADIFLKSKRFDISKTENLHIQNRYIEKTKYFTKLNSLFTDKTKTIVFQYNSKTIRAVDWLSQNDAIFVLTKLKLGLKQ